MAWTLAPALAALRAEVNARWPNRDRSSDGTIGDTAHQAQSRSEHNPDARGVVRAIDITASGIDVQQLLSACIGDPRVHYVIWRGRICSRTYGWTWRPSSGHWHHVHISLRNMTSEKAGWATVEAAADNTSPWFGGGSSTQEDIVADANTIASISEASASAVLNAKYADGTVSDYIKQARNAAIEAAQAAKQAAQAAQTAADRVADIYRPGDSRANGQGLVSLRQEVADCKTAARETRAELVSVRSELTALKAARN